MASKLTLSLPASNFISKLTIPEMRDVLELGQINSPSFRALEILNNIVIGNLTGDARGLNSIDIQSNRNMPNQIASGNSSSAFGYNNTASGYRSSAFGYNNNASGYRSSAVGNGVIINGIDGVSEFGKWTSAVRDSAIRIHSTGMVAMTVQNRSTEYLPYVGDNGSEVDNSLAAGMFAIRRNGLQFILDYNDSGVVKNIILGIAT